MTFSARSTATCWAARGSSPTVVEDPVVGCTAPFGEQSRNIARNAWLQEGFPPEVPCGSARTAGGMVAAPVASGVHDVVVAAGVEHMEHVPMAWQRELKPDPDRVNVNDGAIALGHPVGATGGRLQATVVAEMQRRDVELGLVTMCCGGLGTGTGTLLQRV